MEVVTFVGAICLFMLALFFQVGRKRDTETNISAGRAVKQRDNMV